MGPTTGDARWVRQAFLVAQEDLDKVDQQNRVFTSASIKFTDTTLGGNLCINPPPQFTRNADLRPPNKGRSNNSSGMGRHYSEALDDNNQIIYVRCGVPAFNKMTTFFSDFYSTDAGQLARTGRAGGLFYSVGYATGFVVSILSWKLLAVHMLGFGLTLLQDKPRSKFYYMKPTMPLYWNAVSTIVNQIAVNRGVVPRVGGNDIQNTLNSKYEFTQADIDKLHNAFPQMFNSGGSIDVYALATRAQRLARRQEKMLQDRLKDVNANVEQVIKDIYSTKINADSAMDYRTYLNQWIATEVAQPAGQQASSDAEITQGVNQAAGATPSTAPSAPDTASESIELSVGDSSSVGKFIDFLKAEWDDGGAFASFRVDSTGPVSESFSSQVADSELATKLNNMSSGARNMAFDFENGNIVGGLVGDILSPVISAVRDFAGGFADSVKLSGLAVLAGAAYVDIPKHWTSSAAQLPRSQYTIKLVSPYGNVFSQLINIYVPLSMLLAMALPLSTGKQSYTSPFLCELYDQGRCISRLCMIDSMTITRGIGNTGWNNAHEALGVEVQFSFIDLSSVMFMPISSGFSLKTAVQATAGAVRGGIGGGVLGSTVGSLAGPVGTVAGGAAGAAAGAAVGAASALGVFDDDNTFTDYMNILGSTSLADNVYPMRRFKRNLTQKLAAFESWRSVSHMASFAGDLLPSRIINAFYRGVVR